MRARRAEIEEALRVRVYAISDPAEALDPEYADALRAAVEAALEYGFAGIEAGAERLPPLPPTLLTQARIAARNQISLDIVLRRYFGGYVLLGDFLIEAAEAEEMSGVLLKRLLRTQAALFDRLVAAVSEEYRREIQTRASSAAERRLACVKRLLAGELSDALELNYDFGAWHIAAIAKGSCALTALGELAASLDRRLLAVQSDEVTAWAWLGGRRRIQPAEVDRALSDAWPERLVLALGEPAQGLAGWRLSHQQASAALIVALREPSKTARYADVALLASMLQDNLLATSLQNLYLSPLERARDEGETLRKTLRAYFDADRNVSSTATALGVSRQTVNSKLRTAEMLFGRPLNACALEVVSVLRLYDLEKSPG